MRLPLLKRSIGCLADREAVDAVVEMEEAAEDEEEAEEMALDSMDSELTITITLDVFNAEPQGTLLESVLSGPLV